VDQIVDQEGGSPVAPDCELRKDARINNGPARFVVIAAASIAAIFIAAGPSWASLGPLKTTRIVEDSRRSSVASTFDPHLAKLVTDGKWSYAIFTRTTSPYTGQRAWIFKRRAESQDWKFTGREFRHLLNFPGLLFDKAGRLHVVFTCLEGEACTHPAVGGDTPAGRFYDLIFRKHRRNGAIELGRRAPFSNHNECMCSAWGYPTASTDPDTGQSLAATSLYDYEQALFELGTSRPEHVQVPSAFPPSYPLYPQIAISPGGVRYYAASELMDEDDHDEGEEPERPGELEMYKAVVLYRLTGLSLSARPVFSDYVDAPEGQHELIYQSNMAFGPGGELYLLYMKREAGVESPCPSSAVTDFTRPGRGFLVKETSPGSGTFGTPIEVGCHGWSADLQVDRSGRIYIVEDDYAPGDDPGAKLTVSVSSDGGANWNRHTYDVPHGPQGLPKGSTDIWQPTLIKPWTSAHGYDPDVLHGMVANWRTEPGKSPMYGRSWSALEFRIKVQD
jgi:hypothetical protein